MIWFTISRFQTIPIFPETSLPGIYSTLENQLGIRNGQIFLKYLNIFLDRYSREPSRKFLIWPESNVPDVTGRNLRLSRLIASSMLIELFIIFPHLELRK